MTQNNIKIAVTGGIGSGKTTVCDIIKEQGYSVISCDEIYNRLLRDKSFLNSLVSEFGHILNGDGTLSRKKLSEIVFSDKDKLARLNEITHPEIMKEALKQMSGNGVYFCEIPLLFEGEFEALFDKIIVILRDKELRVASITKRDDISEFDAQKRINNQCDYDNLGFEKYYVIHNDLDLTNLKRMTIEIIDKIVKAN